MTVTFLDVVEVAAFSACSIFLLLFCIQLAKKSKTLFGISRATYSVAALLSAFGLLVLFYGFFIEPDGLEVRHLRVNGNATGHFVFISDAHVPSFNPAVFEKIRQQHPDAIFFGGDVRGVMEFSDTPESAAEHSAFFSNLSSIAPVYAVSGNHDRNLPPMGATFLENERAVVAGATVCGVDDWRPAEVSGCDIALVHTLENLQFAKDASIVLLGHTHGGGINLPFFTENVLNFQFCSNCGTYRYGEHVVEGKRIYVTSGLANHVRFLSTPEIVVVDVVK